MGSRLDEMQTTILRAKLVRLVVNAKLHRSVASIYLKGIKHNKVQLPHVTNVRSIYSSVYYP